MKKYLKPLVLLYLIVISSLTALPVQAQDPDDWEEQDAVLVGRISHVEGQISRYDPESDRWVSTTREAPFGTEDLLRSDLDARAEILLPNNTWIRIDGDTRLQLTALTSGVTEVDLPLGNGRLYNKSTRTELNATTPFGRITAPPGSAFDLYVGESGVDIVAIENNVFFVHNISNQQHEISADSAALSADMETVTAISDNGDADWTAWNRSMDALWADRMASRGDSATYLPPELHSEAHALDKHGHWERVHYEGRYYRFWRPVHISASWSPFSWGAWIVWHGDHVWVPHEPFGYVTHHYGNWIFTAGHWYWAPPVTRIMVRARLPLLHIGFGWYPGRVSWIHSGAHVGWIPLAPHEPYYTHRHWGRRSIVAVKWRHHHRHHAYKHRHHAVVIHRNHLYRSNNYRHARIRGISHTTIHKKYRTARVLDRKVLKDHRRHEKNDRFHRKHRRDDRRHLKEIRHKRDRRHYARHFDRKDRHRSVQRRAKTRQDLKSAEDRHTIKKKSVRKAHRRSDEAKIGRRTEQKRLSRKTRNVHREATPKADKERSHRNRRDQRALENRERRTKESRSRKQDKVRPRREHRIEKKQTRPTSPRMVTAPDRRASDRRHSKISEAVKRQRSGKEINGSRTHRKTRERHGIASQRHERRGAKNQISSRRTPSQPRHREARQLARRSSADRQSRWEGSQKRHERTAVRSAPAQRQRQHAVRMPTERRAPERSLSRQSQRPQCGGQGWHQSSDRRHHDSNRGNRSGSGRQRAQRRY